MLSLVGNRLRGLNRLARLDGELLESRCHSLSSPQIRARVVRAQCFQLLIELRLRLGER
jgi:hypothetical protein